MSAARTTRPGPGIPEEDTAPLPKDDERPMPTNVVEAIARIMGELPAIGKKTSEEHGRKRVDGESGISYSYRSIEQIVAETRGLMSRYGVVPVPRVIDCDIRYFTMGQRNTEWSDTRLTVEFDFYGPGGVTDKLPEPARTVAVGRDNSDKGANKAMTQAEKQVLIVMFQIADSDSEGEHDRTVAENVRAGGTSTEPEPALMASVDDVDSIGARIVELPEKIRAGFYRNVEAAGGGGDNPDAVVEVGKLTLDWAVWMADELTRAEDAATRTKPAPAEPEGSQTAQDAPRSRSTGARAPKAQDGPSAAQERPPGVDSATAERLWGEVHDMPMQLVDEALTLRVYELAKLGSESNRRMKLYLDFCAEEGRAAAEAHPTTTNQGEEG